MDDQRLRRRRLGLGQLRLAQQCDSGDHIAEVLGLLCHRGGRCHRGGLSTFFCYLDSWGAMAGRSFERAGGVVLRTKSTKVPRGGHLGGKLPPCQAGRSQAEDHSKTDGIAAAGRRLLGCVRGVAGFVGKKALGSAGRLLRRNSRLKRKAVA
jgi:hypothetical protein